MNQINVFSNELRARGTDLTTVAHNVGCSAGDLMDMIRGVRQMPPSVAFEIEETFGVRVAALRSVEN